MMSLFPSLRTGIALASSRERGDLGVGWQFDQEVFAEAASQ
jgi:hypothetical protein